MVLLSAVSKVELFLSINRPWDAVISSEPDAYSSQGGGGARGIVQAGPCI